jgi:ABC-type multidrug transport system ATPase subunit
MDEILKVENISFAYKPGNPILDEISFGVTRNETTALLGINGAGKSTMIWLIANLLTPSGGQIRLFDRNNRSMDANTKRRIGVLSSYDPLIEFLTLDEHLEYVGRWYGLDKTVLHRRIGQLKDIFGPDEFQGRLNLELSTGNRRKAGILTTLIHSPEFLIWDEPFNSLDAIATVRLKELITVLQKNGTSILMSSQVLEPVEKLCSRVILLDKGKIALNETVRNLHLLKEKAGVTTLEALIYKLGTEHKNLPSIDSFM